jgi:uncharacterized protein (UPF0333 family)
MKNDKRIIFGVVVAVVVLALVIGFYYQNNKTDTGEIVAGQTDNATTTATTTSTTKPTKGSASVSSTSMRTYTDTKHNFVVTYPVTAKLDTSIVQFHDLGNKWRVLAENNNGEAILTVKVFRVDNGGVATGKPYPLFYTSEVRIGASDNVTDCYKQDPGYENQKVADVTINGTKFKKFDFGDAGMMKYVQGSSYRTIKNNKCYAIEQVRNGSSYRDETMTAGLSQATLDAYYNAAAQVVQSFKFTK